MTDQRGDMGQDVSAKGNDAGAEDRYRYIGFDVYPGRIREFWKSDAERTSYLQRVKETAGRFIPLSRANSFVSTSEISLTERIILTISSFLLLAAPFLPWFSFTRGTETFSYSGISVALGSGAILGYLSMGAGTLTVSFILMLVLMLLSMIVGLTTLLVLHIGTADTTGAYVARLRRILTWHYLPILGWVAFFTFAATPTPFPFAESLGLNQLESTFDMGSLAASASVGFWIPFAALWVGAIKGNDL